MSKGGDATVSDKQQTGPAGTRPMHRPLRWLWLAVSVVILDLVTKKLALKFLEYAELVEVSPILDFMRLHNRGAAFSFLADHAGWQRWFFATIAVAASIGLTVWMHRLKADEKLLAVSLALIIGGALGNLYDRLVHGYVVDFLTFHFFPQFPAFNLADAAITLGAIGLIWESVFGEKHRARKRNS